MNRYLKIGFVWRMEDEKNMFVYLGLSSPASERVSGKFALPTLFECGKEFGDNLHIIYYPF